MPSAVLGQLVLGRPRNHHRRIVHQHVDAAMHILGSAAQPHPVGFDRDVTADHHRTMDLRGELVQQAGTPDGQHH
jgi:hypothetical protein